MDIDGIYSPKDMTDILNIGDSTLRKWCIALEEQGYCFSRTENNKRLFTDNDLIVLKHFRQLVQVQNMNINNASILIATKYKDIKGTSFQSENSKNDNRSLNTDFSRLFGEIEHLKELNKQLLLRINEQNEYIFNRLNNMEDRITKRDERLMQVLRETQETQKLIAAATEKKKGFWKKLFKKE